MGCQASVAAVVDDLTTLGARDHWTVTGGVATYAPKPGGWTAQVRAVRVAAHSYERWHAQRQALPSTRLADPLTQDFGARFP